MHQGEAVDPIANGPTDNLLEADLDEDEEHLDAADHFEAQHNFRFEASSSQVCLGQQALQH